MLWCLHGTWSRVAWTDWLNHRGRRNSSEDSWANALQTEKEDKTPLRSAPRRRSLELQLCCTRPQREHTTDCKVTNWWPRYVDYCVVSYYLLLHSQVVCPDCLRPAAYIICLFLLVHLPVPMATSTSIAIKQLQQHFQVVLVKGALCIAYDFITVFSSYVAQS